MKRVVTIQDLSCFGKCSLTVALPVLAAAGVEACPLPTMLLSSHTAYTDPVRLDATRFAADTAARWQQEGFLFDAIYVGYLAGSEQVDFALDFIERFGRRDTTVIVDPAMGDRGKLYSGLPADFPARMRALCLRADIVLPNPTEAALLLGLSDPGDTPDIAAATALLQGLRSDGMRDIALTGIGDAPGKTGALVLSGRQVTHPVASQIDGRFHGTGDLFASVVTAAVVQGKALDSTAALAVDFVRAVVARTAQEDRDSREGLLFEPLLPMLPNLLK